MTIERLEHALALVTVAMPVILGAAHVLRAIAHRLHAYALTTPGTGDDRALARVVAVADWIDAIARAIAHAASLGVLRRGEPNRTPSLERVERETRDPGAEP